jgi:hypothetical protein
VPLSKTRPGTAPGKFARRWLYLGHRWLGIASCLLFAMWFASGLVMLYVPYPSLSGAEKLAVAEPIDWTRVTRLPPIDTAGVALSMRDDVPVWSTAETIFAASADRILPVDRAMAERVSRRFGHAAVRGVERITRDQWTVAGGFNRHRPLWKVALADAGGTELYVSSHSGEVVQRTTRSARFWNWLGSVPHWLYPTVLRQDNEAWRQVVMWVSGPCVAGAVTGMWIGILRTRPGRRRFKDDRITPYHGWMLWHHVAGLVGGLFLLAWIFSGWLSVDPFHWFKSRPIEQVASAPTGPLDLAAIARVGQGAVRVERIDPIGRPLLLFFRAGGSRDVRDAADLRPATRSIGAIAAAARALVPDGRLVAVDRLTAPDAYWYEIGEAPRLPMLRLRFADPAGTWLHVDPATGELVEALDRRRRVYRWLFDLLHKWDLNLLTLHRPVWDIVLWALSILGLVTSVSGVWLGWRRLRRPAHHHPPTISEG